MTSTTESLPVPELKKVFAVASARIDQWSQLNALARSWATVAPTGTQAGTRHADIVKLLGSITRIEYCWAYPGPRFLAAIDEALERRDPAGFARLVQKVSRALLTSDFRRDSLAWDVSGEAASPGLNTLPPDLDATAAHKPYFEVLIVTPTDAATVGARPRRPAPPAATRRPVHLRGRARRQFRGRGARGDGQRRPAGGGDHRRLRVRLAPRPAGPAGIPRAPRSTIDTNVGRAGSAGHGARQGDQALPARARPLPAVRPLASRASRAATRRRRSAACSTTSRSRWRCTCPSSTACRTATRRRTSTT